MSRIMQIKPELRFKEGMKIKFRYMDGTYHREVFFTVLRRREGVAYALDVDVNKGSCIITCIDIYRTETKEFFYLPKMLGGSRERVFPINLGGHHV